MTSAVQSPSGAEYRHRDQLEALVALSRRLGEPAANLVILAEGNTSIKTGDGGLLVKATGAVMARATDEDFVEVDLATLDALIDGPSAGDEAVAAAFSAATRWGIKVPSVEALLHVVCQRYPGITAVAHTHPIAVNTILCSSRASEIVGRAMFPDQIVVLGDHALLIEYIDPGLPLAQEVARRLAEHVAAHGGPPKAIYLANHGMFALGESIDEVERITAMAVKSAAILGGVLAVGEPVRLSAAHQDRIHTRPDEELRRELLRKGQR